MLEQEEEERAQLEHMKSKIRVLSSQYNISKLVGVGA